MYGELRNTCTSFSEAAQVSKVSSKPLHHGVQLNVSVKKGKGKVPVVLLTKHHAMKAYWESGSIAPLIL
jgi:hypothetical protein